MRTKRNGLVRGSAQKSVLDGEYKARLIGIERFTNSHQQVRLMLTYQIEDGPYAGATLIQSAQMSASPWGRLTTVLRDLLERSPSERELREGLDPKQIGLMCLVTTYTDANQSGAKFSAVRKAVRMAAPSAEPTISTTYSQQLE